MELKSASTGYTVELYSFEKEFDAIEFRKWNAQNWTKSIWYALFYVLAVFAGQKWMEKRERFSLRTPLILWSIGLAIFSIIGTIRTLPELLYTLRKYGFEGSICNLDYMDNHVSFWHAAFVMSKVYELGDTAFVILRKQRMVLLHWYHHATVLVYVWWSASNESAPGRWFIVMNYCVHSLMYTYYAVRAMGYRPPTAVNIFVTTSQISQMFVGIYVVLNVYHIQSQGRDCQLPLSDICWCLLMYASYLVLFVHFFYQAYLQPKPTKINNNNNNTNNTNNGYKPIKDKKLC